MFSRFARLVALTSAVAIFASLAEAGAPLNAPLPIKKGSEAVPADADAATDGKPGKIDAVQAREQLMQQLLRAAEAGIVDLKPPEEPEKPDETSVVSDAGTQETPGAETVEAAEAAPLDAAPDTSEAATTPSKTSDKVDAGQYVAEAPESHFVISQPEPISPMEVEKQGADEAEAEIVEQTPSRPPPRCLTRAELSLPDIISSEELARQIGDLRLKLFGEFDAVDAKPAIELAKVYVSVGMLLEARTTIQEYAPDHAVGHFLSDVSSAMLGDLDYFEGSLFKEECIGIQALWRAYGQARIGAGAAALRSEVASGTALEELPIHVRQVVASELGLLAADNGQWDTVRRMEAMALRAASGTGHTLGKTHLLSYRTALWHGKDDQAKGHLAKASDSDIETATQALLIRAQLALESEDVLDDGHTSLRLDLGDLARREIGNDVGRRAFELEARLFSRDKGPDETIHFLSDAVEFGLLDGKDHSGFLAELISQPAYSEVSRPLAYIYLEDPSKFDGALKQQTLRRSLIRSLAEHGVPGMARDLALETDLEVPEIAIELAESFLVAGEPRKSIATVSAVEDGLRQRLVLSKAYLKMGDFERAKAVLDDVDQFISDEGAEAAQVDALKLRAELAGRDYSAAFATSLRKLNANRSTEAAAEAALIALEAGKAKIPDTAKDVLGAEDAEDLKELERLFSLGDGVSLEDIESAVEIEEILEEIESGEEAVLEVIENG